MGTISALRPSPIAGTWYSGNPRTLSSQIDGYLEAARLPDLPGEVVAIVAPHAGHRYSGPVAGYAFKAASSLKPTLVGVISPMHQPYPYPLLTSAHQAYETPLGAIPIDRAAVERLDALLEDDIGYPLTPVANDEEHSLEIELPFLQRIFREPFQLLPVMVRDPSPRLAESLGRGLAAVLQGQPALLVASTDLSHFYPQRLADQYDTEMLRQIEALSPDGVYLAEADGRGFACGLGALMAVLWTAKELGADKAMVLNHATSGDITGDYSSVVGYGAAALLHTKT